MEANSAQRSMGSPGSNKRFGALQVAIFRGVGKVLKAEQGGYDPRVKVGVQQKAWAWSNTAKLVYSD